jgi:Sgf11 (transcriptional regulation protein)
MPDHEIDDQRSNNNDEGNTSDDIQMIDSDGDVVMTAEDRHGNNNNSSTGGGGGGGMLQQRQREDMVIDAVYKDLIHSVCVDVASNMHKLIKTHGMLPPPGRLLVPATNTTSLLRTLERITGISARRELYPDLYAGTTTEYHQQSNSNASSSRNEIVAEDEVGAETKIMQYEQDIDGYGDKFTAENPMIAVRKSDDEIKELLRLNAVETPVSDLLEGRLKRPLLSTSRSSSSSDAVTNAGNGNGDSAAATAVATTSTAAKIAKIDTSGGKKTVVNDDENQSNNKTKFKPDPTSDEDDTNDDGDDDDDDEYKLEDDEDDGDDDEAALLKKKKSKSSATISSTKSDGGDGTTTTATTTPNPTSVSTDTTANGGPHAAPGASTIIPTDIEDSANIVTPDIWGNYPPKEPKDFFCVCQLCNRQIATSRFASHLDKCMGLSTRPLAGGGIGGSSTRG